MTVCSAPVPRLPEVEIVNIASVLHISPFRYPGGKTWLVPTIAARLRVFSEPPNILVDPFAGGGSVPLGLLHGNSVKHVALGEMDPDVSAVWKCIFGNENEILCKRIETFPISRDNVRRELMQNSDNLVDRAFRTLLQNRTFHGGILAPGSQLLKSGEKGRGVCSRWYPETLIKRLHLLRELRPNIDFIEGDAFNLIEQYLDSQDTVFFIDPPYTVGEGKRAGRRLYKHNDVDHERLFGILSKAKGTILMTYDDCPEVVSLANAHAFKIEPVPMKNKHHEKKHELLISRQRQTT